jgi:hypothetical protein
MSRLAESVTSNSIFTALTEAGNGLECGPATKRPRWGFSLYGKPGGLGTVGRMNNHQVIQKSGPTRSRMIQVLNDELANELQAIIAFIRSWRSGVSPNAVSLTRGRIISGGSGVIDH